MFCQENFAFTNADMLNYSNNTPGNMFKAGWEEWNLASGISLFGTETGAATTIPDFELHMLW